MCLIMAHCCDVGGVEGKQHGAGGRMQSLLVLLQGKFRDNWGGGFWHLGSVQISSSTHLFPEQFAA